MKKKFLKKYKINQIQNIKQNYKYIYLFRYNDLTLNEIKIIKKKIKILNYKSLILKQKIINKFFLKVKGQGSLLIIYGNEYFNIIKILYIFKKLDFIFLIFDKKIYSKLNLEKILIDSNINLNINLIKPYLKFLYLLKEIKKANIT